MKKIKKNILKKWHKFLSDFFIVFGVIYGMSIYFILLGILLFLNKNN